MTTWISVGGSSLPIASLYEGDCQPGDRAATPAEISAWQAQQTANAPRRFDFLAFMALFTQAETNAIVASADSQVKLFLLMAAGATFIDMADPKTTGGFAYLVAVNLLTQARATAILGAIPA